MMNEDTLYRDFLAEWIKGKRYNVRPQTWRSMGHRIENYINPSLGNLKLRELSPIVLQRLVNEITSSGRSSGTVKCIFGIVRGSLAQAVKMKIIPTNPALRVRLPRLRRKELHVWDVAEVRHFLEMASRDPYTYVAFHLALLTGMRRGEIVALRWSDVNFETEVLTVSQTRTVEGFVPIAKTHAGTRPIAIDQATVNILREHRKRLQQNAQKYPERFQDSGLVVCTRFGHPMHPNVLIKVWHRLLTESGLLRIRFHDLRHTHASLLLRENVHPKIVSERLGHSSVRMTLDTYSHLLPNMQQEAAEDLGQSILENLRVPRP